MPGSRFFHFSVAAPEPSPVSRAPAPDGGRPERGPRREEGGTRARGKTGRESKRLNKMKRMESVGVFRV